MYSITAAGMSMFLKLARPFLRPVVSAKPTFTPAIQTAHQATASQWHGVQAAELATWSLISFILPAFIIHRRNHF